MNTLIPADKAASEALKEACRALSLKLDAARERIDELETVLGLRDKTIAEQRALLARAGSLSERMNDPAQDGVEVK